MAYRFRHGDRPLEGYVIQRAVGQGGFGEVYYSISDGGREVALKFLFNNPEIELRGVSQCMNLKSPHLVSIFDVRKGIEDDYFIVMEYVSGPSLRDLLIAEPKGLSVQKAAYFVREIGKGLSYLHDRGIVHRDLKPGNIFYEDGYVKIGDYGLSKFISVSRHSAQTASVGTVHYMAPEVGSGNYSRGIDIYALGVILYEMLLGKVPYEGSTMGEVLMKHLTAQPVVDELPHPFADVIRKSLAKDPKDRYQTVDEMVEAIMGVEDIRQSVVGFNPNLSLSGAVRQTVNISPSPVPSPNPPIGRGFRIGLPRQPFAPNRFRLPPRRGVLGQPENLGPRLSEKVERIRDRVQDKLDRLGGRSRPAIFIPKTPSERRQRFMISSFIGLGLLLALGFIVGVGHEDAAIGITSSLLAIAISAGVLSSALITMRPASTSQKEWLHLPQTEWVRRFLVLGCSLPLMMLVSLPYLMNAGRHEDEAWGFVAAMAVMTAFVDWKERVRTGGRGELNPGKAFAAALGAFVLTGIFTDFDDDFIFVAAGVGAVVSLVVQAYAWLVPFAQSRRPYSTVAEAAKDVPPTATPVSNRAGTTFADGPPGESSSGPGGYEGPRVAAAESRMTWGSSPQSQESGRTAINDLPPVRGLFTRAFWSIAAFCLFGGIVATVVPHAVIRGWHPDERAGLTAGSVACFSFLIFALSKTTIRKRRTFWQETARPFLLALGLSGTGACLSFLVLSAEVRIHEDFRAGMLVAAILCGAFFLIILVLRGRKTPPQAVARAVVSEQTPASQVPVG